MDGEKGHKPMLWLRASPHQLKFQGMNQDFDQGHAAMVMNLLSKSFPISCHETYMMLQALL